MEKDRTGLNEVTFYDAIFENTGTATVILEEDCTISLANKEFENLSGYSKTEIEGRKKWTDFVANTEDLERMTEYHRQRRIDPQSVPKRYEFQFIDRQGSIKYISTTIDMIPGTQKSVSSYLDVTDYKMTKEALRESELRYRTLFDCSHDAIILLDRNWNFTSCNYRTLQLFKTSQKEFLGSNPLDFCPEYQLDGQSSLSKARTVIEKSFQGQPQSFEWRLMLKDGSIVDTEVKLGLIELAGTSLLLSNVRDISDRKIIELDREKLISELGRKNSELERFTYTISHDLKNPLITIKGFIGMLEKDAEAGNFEQMRADKEYISNAADKMQHMLDELLELSRIGRVATTYEQIPLEEAVQEAVERNRGKIEESGVQVTISSDLPVVYGERPRLIQLYQNLVDNAVKYIGESSDPRVEIGMDQKNGQPVLFVRDNGIGIKPEYQERIFELFEQLEPSKGGTGLGLAMVKRIVESHGGKIWVESKGPGQGSAFCFTLPGKGGKKDYA